MGRGKDISAPVEDLLNENPSHVALGENRTFTKGVREKCINKIILYKHVYLYIASTIRYNKY